MSDRRGQNEREDLAGERAFSDIGQLLLLFTFLTAWILDSFVFSYSTFISNYVLCSAVCKSTVIGNYSV